MDLLHDNVRTLYLKYLGSALGGALVGTVFSVVDTAIVGHYQGPDGAAALAVFAPVWNIIYSTGLLTGIGGAICFGNQRGKHPQSRDAGNEHFTAALYLSLLFSALIWVGLLFFDVPILTFFGADTNILPLVRSYLRPIRYVAPLFLLDQMLSVFLRSDGDPTRVVCAATISSVLNMIGDYLCVFVLDMGIAGAGLATAVSKVLSMLILLGHFRLERNTLHIVQLQKCFRPVQETLSAGFPAFLIDISMGIVTIIFNRQIMAYFNSQVLSVYSVIVNISTFAQCSAYSIGQAAQPIISVSYGAENSRRIRQTLRYALLIAGLFSLFWTGLTLFAPNLCVRISMTPSADILQIAPSIIRRYGLSFLVLPLNICAIYYFQSLLHSRSALVVSSARGLFVSSILLYAMPALWGGQALWLAMPTAEVFTGLYSVIRMAHYTRRLPVDKT